MDVAVSPAPRLERRLGPVLLTLYGVGVMVGAGIYVLVGTIAGEAGLLAPLAFLVAGLVAAPTALTYSELSVRIPESAGEAAFVRRAFGSEVLSVGVGLTIVVVGTTSAAAVLRGGIGYLTGLVEIDVTTATIVLGTTLVTIAAWGVVESLVVAAVFTVMELLGLVLVIRAGWLASPSSDWVDGLGPSLDGGIAWSGFTLAVVLAFFAFVGFEDIVNLAEEVRRPERTLPIAILGSLTVSSLLYGAVTVAAIRAVDVDLLAASERPLALVYERWSGGEARGLSAIAAVAAINGVLAQVVMASRVLFGLGRVDPRLAWFHQTHRGRGTPTRATGLVGLTVVVGALTIDLASLAEVTSIFLLAVFAVMNLSLIVLRRSSSVPPGEPGFRSHPAVAWLGLAGSLAAFAVAVAV